MRAIVRKCRARMMENPPKDSVFRVRKNRVNSNKIARFKRDKGIDDGDVVMLDAGTLICLGGVCSVSLTAGVCSNSIGYQLLYT